MFLDLLTAVVVGMIAAAVTSARQFERLELDSVVSTPLLDQTFLGTDGTDDDADVFAARVGLVALRGNFSVASAAKMINTISVDIRDHEIVILDFSNTVYMDDSAALVMEQLIDGAMAEDVTCIVMGLTDLPATTLAALNVLRRVPEENFVEDLDGARKVARRILAIQQ